jgi:hypothetical protein
MILGNIIAKYDARLALPIGKVSFLSAMDCVFTRKVVYE